ncbi:alpha/beta hydrolase [Streptomyces sp. NBC_00247]|uniref:alpha/beta hydrolase n=1 Tax=Streptomyces sp. NBC_00247 TaxID=2975689 RepID=UPI002E29290B|nr:alpha/beta hydrolase fold domain-containing protein [Streptomyces sp. NBC_00247]
MTTPLVPLGVTAPGPAAVHGGEIRIPSPAGPLAARTFLPDASPLGWLVWAHGGSWRGGSSAEWYGATADLAATSGFAVVSVDYRLAPGARHPQMVEDVFAALVWAHGRDRAGRVRPVVAVGGDSAGGTLAASAALVCRDRGLPLAAQVLAYPPLDPGCTADSYRRFPGAFPVAGHLRAAWRAYREPDRPRAADGTRLHSTPFEADDLAGVAPAVLATGDVDPVRDDLQRYALLLREAGVEHVLRRFPGTGHGAFLQSGHDPAASLRGWLGPALRRLTAPEHGDRTDRTG